MMDKKQQAVVNFLNIVYGVPLDTIREIDIDIGGVYIDYVDGRTASIIMLDCEE